MKRLLGFATMLILMFIPAPSQTQTQTNAKRDEPPIDCGAYPLQATSLYILPYRVGESYEVVATKEHYVRGNRVRAKRN